MGDSMHWYGRPDGDGGSRTGGNTRSRRLRAALGAAAVCALTVGGVMPAAMADDGGGSPPVDSAAELVKKAAAAPAGAVIAEASAAEPAQAEPAAASDPAAQQAPAAQPPAAPAALEPAPAPAPAEPAAAEPMPAPEPAPAPGPDTAVPETAPAPEAVPADEAGAEGEDFGQQAEAESEAGGEEESESEEESEHDESEDHDDDGDHGKDASVRVDKKWNIDGEYYAEGEQPDGFDADLKLSQPKDEDQFRDAEWGYTYDDYRSGKDLTIKEETDLPDGCWLDSKKGLGAFELGDGANEFVVVNEVNCETTLKLVKKIEPYGYSEEEGWFWLTATADGEDAAVEGHSGVSARVDAGTTYTLDEEATFDGNEEFEEGDWSCEADDGEVEQDGDTVRPKHGQDVTCTVTNELHAKHLEIEKSAGDAIDVGAGIWEIDYEVTVTNPSRFADREYDLTDTLEFGEGITATDAAWLLDHDDEDGVWSDPSGEPTATLADDREIEADSVHTYNVWVRVEVDEDADEDQLDCELNGDDGTGLLNRAVLNHKYEAEACAEVELPEEEGYEHGEEEEEEEEAAPTPSPAPTPAPSPAPAPALAPAPMPGAAAPQPAPVVRPQLAQTGTDSLWLVPGAALLILGGAAATRLSRRKG
ncbi:hypothetical protein AAIH25_19040 [Arthrobacter crystallopoietes]|uniref:hypothetical protein n=1 Tax=Crystallibacter crystallopoietes TaxID=37928 RepID=UPI003D1B4590